MPEGAPLYSNLSPRQHLFLVGRLHGHDEQVLVRESDRLLQAFELAARADDPVGDFSRGMRQKTAIACAILPEPPCRSWSASTVEFGLIRAGSSTSERL